MSGRPRSLDELRQLLKEGAYTLSRHALRRIVERNLTASMIREAGGQAEIIEDYPDDKYSPSCLLLGFTSAGEAIHLQVSRSQNPEVRIITLYRPSPEDWVEYSPGAPGTQGKNQRLGREGEMLERGRGLEKRARPRPLLLFLSPHLSNVSPPLPRFCLWNFVAPGDADRK